MRIGFDLDGVLVDYSKMAVEIIRETYRPDLPPGYTQQTWCFTDILTHDQWQSVAYKLLMKDNMWTYAPAIARNVDALRHYIAGHGDDDVYFITARHACAGGSVHTMTQLWLMDHDLPFKNLWIVADAKEKKGLLQMSLHLDFYLDDLPATIQSMLSLEGLHPYLLDQPYNRDGDAVNLPRVHSVDEFLLEVAIGA